MTLAKIAVTFLILGFTSAELLAQKSPPKTRQRNLSSEKTFKATGPQRQTKVDFDAADISGERKAPPGSLLDQKRADKTFGLVKPRENWRPEMIDSSASIETGKQR